MRFKAAKSDGRVGRKSGANAVFKRLIGKYFTFELIVY